MSYIHTRTVEIEYDFGFDSSEKDLLHLALKNVGIVNMSKYDDVIEDIQYDEKEVIDKEYQYKVITDGGVVLTFVNVFSKLERRVLNARRCSTRTIMETQQACYLYQ